jgi:hypothetical protein
MPAKSGVWVAVGGVIVVLAAAGGLLAGKIIFEGDGGSAAAPETTPSVAPADTPLPDVTPETAKAALTYLDGDGKILVKVTGTADRLRQTIGGADPDGCRTMAGDLNKDYPVDTILDRLHAMPDAVLGEWLSTYWGSALGALDACLNKSDTGDYLADANDALTLINKRIAQLKEAK